MAFSLPVSVAQDAPPALTVVPSGTSSYQQFKNSLGIDTYWVKRIYFNTDNEQQIRGGFTYSHYNSAGQQQVETVTTTLDPYQAQSALYIDVSAKKIILDGRNYIRFPLLANTTVNVKLLAEKITGQAQLGGLNNFQELENISPRMSFLEDYKDYV
jgi:hypothetical protein